MVEFNDPKIQEALDRFGPVIEGHEGRLDAVSADIKAFEQYLTDKVKQPIVVEVGQDIRCPELQDPDAPTLMGMPMFCGGEAIEGDVERLSFEQHHGKWRLTYLRVRTEGHFAMESPTAVWTDETVVEHRPLIEMKAEIRMRAAKKLPDFLKEVAKRFVADPSEIEAPFDGIPF